MAVTNLREGVAAFVVGALTLLGTGCVAQQPQAAGAPPSSSPSAVETAPLATVETSAGAASPPETSSPETSPSEVGPTPRATPHVTFLRSGGVAGFAKGGANVRLADGENGGTRLSYDVEANIGGKLAQLGGRLINGVAKKYADEFFTNFAKALTPAESGPPSATHVASDA